MIRVLLIIGLFLLSLGGCLYYQSLQQLQATFEQMEYELNDIMPGSEIVLNYKITNHANQNLGIYSLSECCAVNARFRAKREPPFEIPPKSTYDIVCTLYVFQPGEFSGQIHCYLADPHLREIVLKVSGTVKKRGFQ